MSAAIHSTVVSLAEIAARLAGTAADLAATAARSQRENEEQSQFAPSPASISTDITSTFTSTIQQPQDSTITSVSDNDGFDEKFSAMMDSGLECGFSPAEQMIDLPLDQDSFDHSGAHEVVEQQQAQGLLLSPQQGSVTSDSEEDAFKALIDSIFTPIESSSTQDWTSSVDSNNCDLAITAPHEQEDMKEVAAPMAIEDSDMAVIPCERDVKSYLFDLLALHSSPTDQHDIVYDALLRLFVYWLPSGLDPDGLEEGKILPFVLSLDGFARRDDLVTGLEVFDRDQLLSQGDSQGPRWLTMDLDAEMFRYGNHPLQLGATRKMYLLCVADDSCSPDAQTFTHHSLLIDNLTIAAYSPLSKKNAVHRIFDEARAQVAPALSREELNRFEYFNFVSALQRKNPDVEEMEWLKQGFNALLRS